MPETHVRVRADNRTHVDAVASTLHVLHALNLPGSNTVNTTVNNESGGSSAKFSELSESGSDNLSLRPLAFSRAQSWHHLPHLIPTIRSLHLKLRLRERLQMNVTW
jgi:hypothetical protein